MKKIIEKICMGFLMIFVMSSQTFAQSNQVPINRSVTKVHTYTSYAAIRFQPDFINTQGCAGDSSLINNTVVIDFTSGKDAKAMYAAVLSAYLTGKKVGFGILGCSTLYGSGVPKGYRVDVGN